MSEEDKIILFQRITDGILEAQRRLFVLKSKLGEDVIIADDEGNPVKISAAEALKQLETRLKG